MEAERTVWTEIAFQNFIVALCVCFISFVVALKIFRCFQNNSCSTEKDVSTDLTFGQCKFPDCVRCRRHKDVLMRARTKLTYYDDNLRETDASSLTMLLRDVQSSYHNLTQKVGEDFSQNYEFPVQKPLIFRVKGIRSQPVWNADEFPGLAPLSENAGQILKELKELLKGFRHTDTERSLWKVNDTASGRWSICHLVDQGVRTEAVTKCPETWRIVSSLPGAMTGNLFGNVAFSVVEPGTMIAQHFGPTNIRIRCHLGLSIPEDCQLTVGGTSLRWSAGSMLYFDETYLHSVQHDGKDTSDDRIILMVDLWHPDLNTEQRSLINYAFSPTTTAEQ